MNNLFDIINDLKIGNIVEVSGTTIKVELTNDVLELTKSYEGKVYPVGQIGSIVKIHFGRKFLFGFVTLLRMQPDDTRELETNALQSDNRIMEVELFSEGSWDSKCRCLKFTRGITTYPLPRQGVYILTQDESLVLYSSAEGATGGAGGPFVDFATYTGSGSTKCRINIDKMFSLHCAILGSTGSGKSCAVSRLIHSILDHRVPSGDLLKPRIVMIDPHGEYGSSFGSRAIVFRAYDPIGADEAGGVQIRLPYWLMTAEEFRTLIIGKTEFEATSQHNIVYKALSHARKVYAKLISPAPTSYQIEMPTGHDSLDAEVPLPGVDASRIIDFDFDKPIPFSLEEFKNHILYLQAARLDKSGKTEQVTQTDFSKGFKSILDKLNVLRKDPRIHFLMKDHSETDATLAHVIGQLVGNTSEELKGADVRIIDISGLPNEVAGPLAAVLARLVFQYKLYQTKDERDKDPVLLVCEEAHRYVPDKGEAQYEVAQTAIRRIAREGRKYGLGLMLVSQRPSDIEGTVIAQCGTWIVLRLTNSSDINHVSRFLPDGLSGMVKALPALAQQEALLVGEGAALPSRIRIMDLAPHQLPRSASVSFMSGWSNERLPVHELEKIALRMSQ